MVKDSPEEIERRLDAGEWLKAGAVATLLGVPEPTLYRWLNETPPRIPYRRRGGVGQREFDPVVVRRMLDDSRKVHGAEAAE